MVLEIGLLDVGTFHERLRKLFFLHLQRATGTGENITESEDIDQQLFRATEQHNTSIIGLM